MRFDDPRVKMGKKYREGKYFPTECPECGADEDMLQPYDNDYYICEECDITLPFIIKENNIMKTFDQFLNEKKGTKKSLQEECWLVKKY